MKSAKSFGLHVICLLVLSVSPCKAFSIVDGLGHIKAFINNPEKVGAVAPCSAPVSDEVVKHLQKQIQNGDSPIRVLEVGAGTGVLTSKIIEVLQECDAQQEWLFDIVEIVPELCDVLHEKFDANANVTIHCISITEWQPEYQYDFIISTLPFMIFEPDFIEEVLNYYVKLMIPGGILSYVSYAAIPEIKAACLWGERKKIHKARMKVIKDFRNRYEIGKRTIINNIPPINIYHAQLI